MIELIKKNILYLAWFQVLVATLGSLYASEILSLPLCTLCWYQRVLMYPLVVILVIGILKKDKNLPFYVLPLSISGMVIAFYHYLLQLGIFDKALTTCTYGTSCSNKDWILFDFITLPLLSFLAFAFVTLAMVIFQRLAKKQ